MLEKPSYTLDICQTSDILITLHSFLLIEVQIV